MAITADADGTTRAYTEFDDVSVGIARAVLGDHAAHARVFFVPGCAECVTAYGTKGERW